MVANNTGGADGAGRRGEILVAARRWMADEGGGRLPKTRDRIEGVNETTVRRHFGSWKAFVEELGAEGGTFHLPKTSKNGRFGEWSAANQAGEGEGGVSDVDLRKFRAILGRLGVPTADADPLGTDVASVAGVVAVRAPRIAPVTNDNVVVILPDIHFPSHDAQALAVAEGVVRALRPGRVVLLGDVLDCSQFSRHGRRSPGESLADDYMETEVRPANALIDRLLESCGRVIMLEGNHEARISRWCSETGLAGASAFRALAPRRLLSEGRGRGDFEYIDYIPGPGITNYYRICGGKAPLIACHGWSYAENAAAVHLRKAKTSSVVFGHCHRQMMVSERDPFSGAVLKAWCPGTLSGLEPLYAVGGAPTTWVHGVSIVYTGTDSFTEYMVTIDRNRCILPDGTEVRG